MKLNNLIACAVTAFGLATTTLSASIIAPGNSGAPDVFAPLSTFTMLATTGPLSVNPAPGSSFNATYTEQVGTDSSNMLCGVAGQCLTFVIDLSNAGPGIVERISTANFVGFITDIGYVAPTAGVVPSSVDRSLDGHVVGFNFTTGPTNIDAGESSATLVIKTDALYYTSGTVSVQDGYAGFSSGFAPTATPEPASMFLLGSALVGLGMSRKALRKRS